MFEKLLSGQPSGIFGIGISIGKQVEAPQSSHKK